MLTLAPSALSAAQAVSGRGLHHVHVSIGEVRTVAEFWKQTTLRIHERTALHACLSHDSSAITSTPGSRRDIIRPGAGAHSQLNHTRLEASTIGEALVPMSLSIIVILKEWKLGKSF